MIELYKLIKYRKALHEEKMWEWVFDIGWGVKNNDYKSIKNYLINNFDEKDIYKLRDFCKYKRKVLKSVLEDYEKSIGATNYYRVSDDGFWDLTAHIVGLGKHWYYSVIKNPDIAQEIAINYMHKENFEYIFNIK